jgi:endogenous inhibitor of DNA gyrase (YacG/DUF329 family)
MEHDVSPAKVPTVRCPQCGVEVPWTSSSKWRPFCSDRCKTIDLGAWASESYRITPDEGADGSCEAGTREDGKSGQQ